MEIDEKEGVTHYEISCNETELILLVQVGEDAVVVNMRVNQAFAFMVSFLSVLGKLASTMFPEGVLGFFTPGQDTGGGLDGEGSEGSASGNTLVQ